MFPDDVHDFLGPLANLVLPFAFEHHPQQRLGPRVAHEQPALARDACLDPGLVVSRGLLLAELR